MGSLAAAASAERRLSGIKRVAVVGAGPAGLAAAKHLLAERAFDAVDVFEQAAQVGGVWLYSPEPGPWPSAFGTGSGTACDGDEVAKEGNGDVKKKPPVFPSPMYEDLHTNIPHTLMRYSDLPFPAGCEIFPSRQVVQKYLEDYAQEVRHVIRFSTQVLDICLSSSSSKDTYTVTTHDLLAARTATAAYDAVVLATGHYNEPWIPPSSPLGTADKARQCLQDLRAFAAAHPGAALHAKQYRTPETFKNQKVVVVGAGPSGLDIAAQIARACQGPLLLSAHRADAVGDESRAHLAAAGVRVVGEIRRFLVAERGVVFAPARRGDVEGEREGEAEEEEEEERVETDVDAVLFCTGYVYAFPFPSLEASLAASSSSAAAAATTNKLITDGGRRVRGLARHLLHVRHPTLAFPALPYRVIPFPLAEGQAAVLARLWSGRLPCPPPGALAAMEREDEAGAVAAHGAAAGPGRAFHVFPKGGDAAYINAMHDWAVRADAEEGKGVGKQPPCWGAELLWQRRVYAQAKLRFEQTGRTARTLEELGFCYEDDEAGREEVRKGETGDEVAG
ncbi:hypothetical protein F4780DRAFT_773617 [Xylariomycetidae sp. FL0641]|nr:hypothetical protein F4780DRAFT_773617 [Xylariomycetidae sp. FL0641]